MLETAAGLLIVNFARLLTGAQARWIGCGPESTQRIYYANHTSHLDFFLLWSSLPPPLRERTRPVAAADYWNQGVLRPYLIHNVFRGVLVDRNPVMRLSNPLAPLMDALDLGRSLIFF